ncbi:MAG: Aspartate kinase [Candidatus Saccharibacteria bacterium]|nr:Aspartate kinase [Candidatus Saccharibacteria bacterium]
MQEYPFLSKFLRQGIINYRALARDMEPEISGRAGVKVSVASIAVSLQRLHHRDADKIESLIGRLRGVVVVSDISAITVAPEVPMYAIAAQLIADNRQIKNPFCLVLRGYAETTCLAEKALLPTLLRAVGPDVRQQQDNLVALIITRELLHTTEVGGLSYPLQVLAEHGLLAREVTATATEEIITVDAALADQAAAILRQAMAR